MRKTIYVQIDIEDTSDEQHNWLADTIALGHSIQDRLNEANNVTIHSLEVIPQDSVHWYDYWNFNDGHISSIASTIDIPTMDKYEKEFYATNPPRHHEELDDYNSRFATWLNMKGHKLYVVDRPGNTFGWFELNDEDREDAPEEEDDEN